MDSPQEQQIIKKNEQLQNDIKSYLSQLVQLSHTESDPRNVTVKLINLINQFEPNPKLLDPNLDEFIEILMNLYLSSPHTSIKQAIGEVVYTFAKIRGFKQITLYFSSDIYVISKLINLTGNLTNEFEIFLCLIWLCNLVLVPFDLHDIEENLQIQLYDIAIHILNKYNNGSKNQVIASILLSRLLTRSDCDLLSGYFQGMNRNWPFETEDSKLGYFLTINKVLKRKQLTAEHINMIYHVIIHDLLIGTTSTLNIVYSIKILSKLGKYYIKQREYTTVNSIVNNLINDIMNKMISQFDTKLRFSMAKGLSGLVKELSHTAVNYQCQLIDFIVSQLEIPNPDEIVDLNLRYNELNIAKYHTILLTVGYICLNKSLPQQYTTKLLNICHQCLFFKIKRLSITLGKQIRDSSCFIIWSICRCYYDEHINIILVDLIKALIFDTDLIIKKCCIAVIQEIMGRFNNKLIKMDGESRGEFVISFMNIFNELTLTEGITYEVVDLLLDKLDLSFLVPELVKVICEEDADGRYLRKLIDQNSQYELIPRYEYNIDDIIEQLVKHNRYHILYDLPELPIERLTIFENFHYEDHKQDMALGYLKFLTSAISLTDLDWTNLFKIINLNRFSDAFQVLFSQIDVLPYESILYHLPNSTVLSNCLFNYKHFTQSQLKEIVHVMKDPTVNADIRANLINNLSDNFRESLTDKLYDLFDDYTITIQGDVGSKIRTAMINLVRANIELYRHDKNVKLKLIRLSGELMDKIRFASFGLLHESLEIPTPPLDNYWGELFQFYKTLQSGQSEFWRGVVFTLGSFTGNQQVLNDAFDKLLWYGPTNEDFQCLLEILSSSGDSRHVKCQIVTLNLFLKLFQANFQFPHEFNHRDLFVKSYNLHINTNNATRITAVIRLFYFLSQIPDFQAKIYSRFIWLLKNHKLEKVRLVLGQEILFEVVNDLQNEYLLTQYQSIDWFNLNEKHIQTIQDILKQ
ncbi:uncharacterized protein SPAPADRAFT_154699 [Spathaspora passalidarum NRRL Y-27907]|uniref:Tubulin-folding cofactor D ARM repeats domain-containing protein n=1 Tax=Spathaspora passalidarum (strain NRRL Y-27907 / 11-Y1) TaxID=619300 RepID=G3AQD5_SPAPN|nr:uncharacterized protein SPAPADRAFT_154699 [Spathaspora passalidarum NRRL Y-27907]EGW31482.1 hypothetical protein SPAPADRAFT_154699 [Spathaspora passalidarum NRRL Y-27907]